MPQKKGLPRKPTGYNLFIKENFDSAKAGGVESKYSGQLAVKAAKEEVSELARAWGMLSPAEKADYKARAAEIQPRVHLSRTPFV